LQENEISIIVEHIVITQSEKMKYPMKMTNHILEMENAAGFRTRLDLRPML